MVFNVLLDKIQGNKSRGLRLSGEDLKAARFYREGRTGVADSVQAVQDAGLLQVPTYAIVHGRSFVGLDDPTWSEFHDSLGERLTLSVDKDYEGVPKGEWVVDVQGGGLFMSRHEVIRRAVKERKLVNGAIRISPEDKDLLLGERQVYFWNGQKLEIVPVKYFFTSFEQFQDVSGTPEFQRDLRDLSAVYVVLRIVEEARKNSSSYRPISEQLTNPDLIISAGSKDRLRKMLMEKELDSKGKETSQEVPRFKWTQFGSGNDGYTNVDTGRVGVLGDFYCDDYVNFYSNLYDDGVSGGVAPEALEAWREAQKREKSPGLESRV